MVIMKKTQWIELFHDIRQSFVSFTAIVIFVALATGLYTGISQTGKTLDSSIETQYTLECFHNFALSYPYGFDGDFIDSLTEDGLVDCAEGCYETYRYLESEENRCQIKLSSLTEKIDRPTLVSGTMPKKAGEAAVNIHWAESNHIEIGDTLRFEERGGSSGDMINVLLEGNAERLLARQDGKNCLTASSFRVTALVESAEYMGKYSDSNGIAPDSPDTVATVIFVSEKSFDKTAFSAYPKVVAVSEGLSRLGTSSTEYRKASEELKEKLQKRADKYTSKKNADIVKGSKAMLQKLREIPGNGAKELCAELENITEYGAFIETRQMNISFVGIHSVMDTFGKMRFSLVSLFVVIGILVCYSTISRLVYDRTVLIGTKKALGFTSREIIRPFLIYSGVAACAGLLLGALLGRFIIEPVMISSVRKSYRMSTVIYDSDAGELLIFALIQFVLLILTAFSASARVSKKKALGLLTGEHRISDSEHRWHEKLVFRKNMPLMKMTVIKNCLCDGRRVFATVIGVMGCAALVVCALSAYNNLVGSLRRNMEKITTFDSVMYFDGGETRKNELSRKLEKSGAEYADVLYVPGATMLRDGTQIVTRLYAVGDDSFYDLFHMYDVGGKEEKRAENGAWVNIGYAENCGASVGDMLCFTDSSGQERELPIEGIFDYYLMNYQIVVPRGLYEEKFEGDYAPNAFLLNTAGTGAEKVKASLASCGKDIVFVDFRGENEEVFESVAGITRAVAAVYLVLSVVFAVLLLLNLFTMFIDEKKTELITLMINGFSRKTAEKYISTDTKFLAAVGIALGLVVGSVMGKYSLDSFNNSATHFLNRVDITGCVIGAVFAAVLTYIMCRIALRKVRKFSLSDINTL